MSFFRQYDDVSSWRHRATDIVSRRRSLHIKQILFVVASLTIILSYVLFIKESISNQNILSDHLKPPHPAPHDVASEVTPESQHTAPAAPYIHIVDTHIEDIEVHGPEPLVFSLIMFSENAAAEGAVLMKSILMYSSVPVEFHIICDEPAQQYLEQRLSLVTHPSHDVLARFYRIPFERMLARIEREGAITTDHSAGVPGLMKLFIHEILPDSIQRAVFIDTDAFFITDPALLWDYFTHLRPTTAISMPTHPEQSAPHWHHANRICSCIMLLDLARLRALRLMDSSFYRAESATHVSALAPPAFEAMFGTPGPEGHYEDVKLGDQGYWWAIVSHRPDIFEHLSFEWEVSSCLLDMYLTGLGDDGADEADELRAQIHTYQTPHEGEVILPKMLHFNCLDGVDRYYEWPDWTDPTNPLARRWYPAVQYHVGFKWLWLNHHRSSATLKVETVENATFADEQFAQYQLDRDWH